MKDQNARCGNGKYRTHCIWSMSCIFHSLIVFGSFVFRFCADPLYCGAMKLWLDGVLSVCQNNRHISMSLPWFKVDDGWQRFQWTALDVGGRQRLGPVPPSVQVDRVDPTPRCRRPGCGDGERLATRVDEGVDIGATTPRDYTSHGSTEVMTTPAVDEQVQRRVGDHQEVAESSVEEERVRTSEKTFIHRTVHHLLPNTTEKESKQVWTHGLVVAAICGSPG